MNTPSKRHCKSISRQAPVAPAQSNLQIKLDGITLIIDTILLAQIQAPFKTFCPVGGCIFTGGTGGTGGGAGGGGFGGGAGN